MYLCIMSILWNFQDLEVLLLKCSSEILQFIWIVNFLLQNLDSCFQKCDENRTNTVKIDETLSENYELKLLCRDNSSLTIQINDITRKEELSADRHLMKRRSLYNELEKPKRLERQIIYLVKVQQSDEQVGTRLIYLVSFLKILIGMISIC